MTYRVFRQFKGDKWFLRLLYDGNETEVDWTLEPAKATRFSEEGANNECAWYADREMEAA